MEKKASATKLAKIMDLKFSHLSYFVAVAEERSFNRGAARLHLSQPTLSRQIKELESKLEVELFVRGKTGISLTFAGAALLDRARGILQAREEMLLSMRALSATKLRVGYIAPSLFGAVGEAIAEMRQLYPELRLEVKESAPGHQIELLRSGEIDIAFLGHFRTLDPVEVELHSLYPIPLAAVLPSSHPLAGREALNLTELARERFVGLREELYPGRQANVKDACLGAGFSIEFDHLADGLISLFAMIAHGQGVSLVPSCASTIAYSQVTFVQLDGRTTDVPFMAATRQGGCCPLIATALDLCRAHGSPRSS